MAKYKSVNLPEELVDKIDEIVKDKTNGYSSRADFMRDAVRLKFKEMSSH